MEVAAGVVAVEQVASTAVEAGVAYGIAKPTPGLSATFTRISSPAFLPRLNHSLTAVNGQIYIFGGEDEKGDLAGDEVHIISLPLKSNEEKPDYKCVPSLGEGEDGKVPGKRAGHTAVAVVDKIYLFGGRGEDDKPIEEMGRVWMYNTKTLGWSYIDPAEDASIPPARYMHGAISLDRPAPVNKLQTQPTMTEQITSTISKLPSLVKGTAEDVSPEPHGTILIHGGLSSPSNSLSDTWSFNISTRSWSALPALAEDATPSSTLALSNSTLYTMTSITPLSSTISSLPIKPKYYINLAGDATEDYVSAQESWSTIEIPTNPLTPGPKARKGAPFLPIATGAGRDYIIYLMGEQAATQAPAPSKMEEDSAIADTGEKQKPETGAKEEADTSSTSKSTEPVYLSDTWAYGLSPSGITPAGLKDAIRSKVGASTVSVTWLEVGVEANVEPNTEAVEEEGGGKAHPGPRAWFAADSLGANGGGGNGGKGVVIWGGRNGRGEVEGDGWIVSIN